MGYDEVRACHLTVTCEVAQHRNVVGALERQTKSSFARAEKSETLIAAFVAIEDQLSSSSRSILWVACAMKSLKHVIHRVVETLGLGAILTSRA
jgi:hypothetical protein